MVGYARQAGVYAFWAQKPPFRRTVRRNLHWADADGKALHYPINETRCVLVDTMPGHGSTHMFARLEPCAARRADGLVCEASQAAPAPPPGAAATHWRDPAPPPPPAIRSKSIRTFVNTKVRPLTEAICTEATEGRSHRAVCLEMAEMLSEWRVAGYVPGSSASASPRRAGTRARARRAPTPTAGATAASPSAPTRRASAFCSSECAEGLHAEIRRLQRPRRARSCRPARPARRCRRRWRRCNRPCAAVARRRRSSSHEARRGHEQNWMADCEPSRLTSARSCRSGTPRRTRQPEPDPATLAMCEGVDTRSTASAAARTAAQGRHLHLPAAAARGAQASTTAMRRITSMLPYCACQEATPPPPRAAPAAAARHHGRLGRGGRAGGRRHGRHRRGERLRARGGARARARAGAALEHAATSARLAGEAEWARRVRPRVRRAPPRHAARRLGDRPRVAPPVRRRPRAPASPPPPLPAPSPPRAPSTGARTSAATPDGQCDDGGLGPAVPAAVRLRLRLRRLRRAEEVETACADSCTAANDGFCQDGGERRLRAGDAARLCGYGTDCTDCGARTIESYGEDSYSTESAPPLPSPAVAAVASRAPRPTAAAWVQRPAASTRATRPTAGPAPPAVCDDGGAGAVQPVRRWAPTAPTAATARPPRARAQTSATRRAPRPPARPQRPLRRRRPPRRARVGTCAWGTDCADCGARRVAVPEVARRGAAAAGAVASPPPTPPPSPFPSPPSPSPSPPPPPPPPPPSPSPHPPVALDDCECACYASPEGEGCPTRTPTSGCARTRPRSSTTASRTPCSPRSRAGRAARSRRSCGGGTARHRSGTRAPRRSTPTSRCSSPAGGRAPRSTTPSRRASRTTALQVDHTKPSWYTGDATTAGGLRQRQRVRHRRSAARALRRLLRAARHARARGLPAARADRRRRGLLVLHARQRVGRARHRR